ncbi:alpha amylase N-terminal ig-like domain-containing protein [Anaerocolumna sp. MB42-C2]|uniref:alpha amylase N-terminal ig-like domain-containing protein n=1 Tax=Anaerocolumna sp. MB42-C2 TaxID=3070997 RepID=UPI0027DFB13F|nr:alpha amylase N-terminal ig-like domain-containing protein [Anaerocolumna sp. MB42-C2]WMJ86224.1 alpha amylase N-terminal ig-like domain-containing protein [Anaerocolumna sp. MB42-C2]
MIKEAIRHINTKSYVYLRNRNRLIFRIRTGREDIKNCILIYWARTNPAEKKEVKLVCKQRDALFDYYEVEVIFSRVARYQKYYFKLEGHKNDTVFVNSYGIYDREPDDGYFEFLYANQNDIFEIPDWAKGIIYYQIFPERFNNGKKENDRRDCVPWGSLPTRENYMGGDLKGITDKIGYLKEFGIQCIYLNPIFKADFNHKYATTDYYEIDPEFGTLEEFRELVAACHNNNIRIILDGVFNHTGVQFEPFRDLLKNQEKSNYKEWFHVTKYPVNISNNCYECVGAYKWMPRLNTSNPEVRNYILGVMSYWIEEFHIDGWRLDVADEVDSLVWQEARLQIKSKYPDKLLLGETWGYGRNMLQGNSLDSIMNYVFRDVVMNYFALEKIGAKEFDGRINQMLAAYPKETNQALYNLLDSHDTERFLTLCGENTERFKLAASFQFFMPGAPAVYYGDEVGMTGGNDPDCRKAMIWEKEEQKKELLQWYQWLIRIRKEYNCIRFGDYRTVICEEEKNIYGFVRFLEDEELYVIFHNSGNSTTTELPVLGKGQYVSLTDGEEYFAGNIVGEQNFYNGDILEYKGTIHIDLGTYSMKVIKKVNGGI